MDITLAIVAFLLSLVGIIGCIVPILPGLVLNYIAILCLYFTSYALMDFEDAKEFKPWIIFPDTATNKLIE